MNVVAVGLAEPLLQLRNLLQLRSHFDNSLIHQGDVEWLFVLTFPNGGSAALAKLLLTAPDAVSLTGKAEGQWLIPSLCRARVKPIPS